MSWVKLDDAFYDNDAIRSAGKDARALYLAGLCRCAAKRSNGKLAKHDLGVVAAQADVKPAVVRRLLELGLWEDAGDVYVIRGDPLWKIIQHDRAPIPYEIRFAIYERDGFLCVECGAHNDLSLDHIYPHSRGGSDDAANLRTLCRPCNRRKGARLP